MTAAAAAALEMKWEGRIVALADLHGDVLNTLLLLEALGVIDRETRKWKGGNTLLIQTGDIVDRGPDGKILYDLFMEWQVQAREAGGKVLQLIGNHDAMNVCGDFRYVHPNETAQFGGLSGRRAAFSDEGKYGTLLRSLPAGVNVNGLVFTHAGISPAFAALGLSGVHQLLGEELRDGCAVHHRKQMREFTSGGNSLFASGGEGPLWTRLYTMSPPHIACPQLNKALKHLGADIMVVGHTVQESLRVETYCEGKLLAIDTGISRYVANSPKALEITPNGAVYEVSVRLEVTENSDDTKAIATSGRRKLNTWPLSFYSKRRAPPQGGSRGQGSPVGAAEAGDSISFTTEEL
ncbi:uncharacterized protein C1840.07c-like [Cyclospora cayetanensis]|uniref:Uncharacterized protein C1840.07c-like n=1 Tax=Cyclospora cayetanensis TaxID=88456 RepID=A0A6P6RRY5_9EIME|nr:uncharacterized protein C1840.07c-like [Cyclospora cayetanensis]